MEITVCKFLGMMMMSNTNTIDLVVLRMRGFSVKKFDRLALRKQEYLGFGNGRILTFEIHDKELILNLKPTI